MKSSIERIQFAVPPSGFSLTPQEEMTGLETDSLPSVSAAEMEQACDDAYQRGIDEGTARVLAELQEHRDALGMLQTVTLQNLSEQHAELLRQVGSLLPGLAMEVARRVYAGFQPSAEQVDAIVKEVLGEMSPSAGAIDIYLCPRDLDLITEITPDLQARYPTISLLKDPALVPGDCRATSRFGAVDARLETKLCNIAKSLAV